MEDDTNKWTLFCTNPTDQIDSFLTLTLVCICIKMQKVNFQKKAIYLKQTASVSFGDTALHHNLDHSYCL